MPDFRAKMHQKSIYSAPPDPLAGFGPTSKGRGGMGGRGMEGRGKERGKNGEGREEEI